MALTLTYSGKEALPKVTGYQIWLYQLTGTPGELKAQERVALAFPGDVDVRDPAAYPEAQQQLAGTFVERPAGSSRLYVGRTVTTAGSVTIASSPRRRTPPSRSCC